MAPKIGLAVGTADGTEVDIADGDSEGEVVGTLDGFTEETLGDFEGCAELAVCTGYEFKVRHMPEF